MSVMTEHKIGLKLQENRAFAERVASHTLGVINLSAHVDEKARIVSDTIGTGTACDWEGTKIVLTAKHVVQKAQPNTLQFILRIGQAIDWDADPKAGFAPRVTLQIERIIRSKDEDLAAIVLKPDGLEDLNIRFCELPKQLARTKTGLNEKGALILLGYPDDQAFQVSELKTGNVANTFVAYVPTFVTGRIASPSDYRLSSRFDPENHILISFEPRSPGRKPHGYSGAGVWCDPAERSGSFWSADPLLFAMQIEAYTQSRLLIAISAPSIRKFLKESL